MSNVIILDPNEKPPIIEDREYKHGECEHDHTEISFKKATFQCKDCGAYLDAFAWLCHAVQRNERWAYWRDRERQFQLDQIREKKRVAMETLEAAGVTVEEYAKYIENAQTRKEQLDLDVIRYNTMVEKHKATERRDERGVVLASGDCPDETCYLWKRRDHYSKRCFVCDHWSSITTAEVNRLRMLGLPVHCKIPTRYNKARAALRKAGA